MLCYQQHSGAAGSMYGKLLLWLGRSELWLDLPAITARLARCVRRGGGICLQLQLQLRYSMNFTLKLRSCKVQKAHSRAHHDALVNSQAFRGFGAQSTWLCLQ